MEKVQAISAIANLSSTGVFNGDASKEVLLPNAGRKKLMDKIRLRHIGIAILALKAILVGYLFICISPDQLFCCGF